MTHATGIMLDTARNNIVYGPYLSAGNFEGAVIFGRAPEGCEHANKVLLIDSMKTLYEYFGAVEKDRWLSGFLPAKFLQTTIFKVRVYMTTKECLFEAMRDYAASKTDDYQECIEFCCKLFPETSRYVVEDADAAEPEKIAMNFERMLNNSAIYDSLKSIDANTLRMPNERLRESRSAVNPNHYANVGRSHNAKKRW